MAYLIWTTAYHVGHPEMDRDHRHLASCLNRLVDRMLEHNEQGRVAGCHADVEQAMEKLLWETEAHFAREEILMDVHGYPGITEHMTQHRALIDQLRNATLAFRTYSRLSVPHAIRFWREWFEDHIENFDMALSLWIAQREYDAATS